MSLPADALMILAACSGAVVHLHFVARFDFDPAEGKLGALAELLDETTNGTVLA